MCCDSWDNPPDTAAGEAKGECPSCGGAVAFNVKDGIEAGCWAITGCNYSPESCEVCGAHDCDLSC